MADIEIKISGAFLKDPDMRPIVRAAIQAGGLYFKGKIAQYPPSPGGRPNPYLSPKQRRFLAIAISKGELRVPYRRGQSPGSKKLGQSWTVAERDDGLTAVVGTNVDYAGYVQKEGMQSRYHKDTGWRTDAQVKEQEEANTVKAVNAEIAKGIVKLNK